MRYYEQAWQTLEFVYALRRHDERLYLVLVYMRAIQVSVDIGRAVYVGSGKGNSLDISSAMRTVDLQGLYFSVNISPMGNAKDV